MAWSSRTSHAEHGRPALLWLHGLPHAFGYCAVKCNPLCLRGLHGSDKNTHLAIVLVVRCKAQGAGFVVARICSLQGMIKTIAIGAATNGSEPFGFCGCLRFARLLSAAGQRTTDRAFSSQGEPPSRHPWPHRYEHHENPAHR